SLFFFSSRRRHTRFSRDWSSDVCSSDLTLPFFLVGTIFYFTGSMQGTAEAFRSTNLIWHFTDFTVAHSHLTMYGIIAFFLWAGEIGRASCRDRVSVCVVAEAVNKEGIEL